MRVKRDAFAMFVKNSGSRASIGPEADDWARIFFAAARWDACGELPPQVAWHKQDELGNLEACELGLALGKRGQVGVRS